MSLMSFRHGLLRQVIALFTMLSIGLAALASAWAQQSTPAPGAGGGVTWKVCNPGVCMSKADKAQYAATHNCKFPEDICEGKTTAESDDKGAVKNDQGFWGSLWSQVKGAVVQGYEFVKGVYAGLKGQIEDLISLFSNPGEVVQGLIELGKAFFNDPKGTLAMMGELLGQEAADTFNKATQCGAYDLGKVVGSYVSPVLAIKLASQISKYSGKVADAAKALKPEIRCASFGAGTLVMTPNGLRRIEELELGELVYSRNELSFADRPQAITDLLGRTAPSYRVLSTEMGSVDITDEHPVWVQGKGWTTAAEVEADDVIAAEQGDLLVTDNQVVAAPLRVYNFSVANTPNYFVGTFGMWVHNASRTKIKCIYYSEATPWDKLTSPERGFRAEVQIFDRMKQLGFEPVGASFDPTKSKSPAAAFAGWHGQTGIDGLYYNPKTGKYVIVESKAHGGEDRLGNKDTKGKMPLMKTGERQMSNDWIDKNLEAMLPGPANKAKRDEIRAGIADESTGTVTKVYVWTDKNGNAEYRKIKNVGDDDVSVSTVGWP